MDRRIVIESFGVEEKPMNQNDKNALVVLLLLFLWKQWQPHVTSIMDTGEHRYFLDSDGSIKEL